MENNHSDMPQIEPILSATQQASDEGVASHTSEVDQAPQTSGVAPTESASSRLTFRDGLIHTKGINFDPAHPFISGLIRRPRK